MIRVLSAIGLVAIVITVAQFTVGLLVLSVFTGSIQNSLNFISSIQ